MLYGGVHCWLRSGLEDNPGRESWRKQKLNMWWCFVLVLDHCLQGAKQVKHVTTMKPLGGSLESGQEGSGCNSLFQGSNMFAAMMLRIAITSECLLFLLAFKLLTVSYISYISQICWFARVKAHVCRLCRSKSCFSWAWVICWGP